MPDAADVTIAYILSQTGTAKLLIVDYPVNG
jgi:hypothetical protein